MRDVLLTWLVQPGRVLDVGLTDGYDGTRRGPGSAADLALQSSGRQLFVKMSWLFRG